MLNAEDDQIIPSDVLDIVFVGDREGTSAEKTLIDNFAWYAAVESTCVDERRCLVEFSNELVLKKTDQSCLDRLRVGRRGSKTTLRMR
jgi:hypothetical protein